MNFYVSVINQVVDHIENSIGEELTLAELSARACISDYHFNRIFKTVTGITLKQYILGRKLTFALVLLKNTDKSVLDIALDLGFQYPEVFSRAFKKQFGLPPTAYRIQKTPLKGIQKASVVERDIMNYGGKLALKGTTVYIESAALEGIYVKADKKSGKFQQKLKQDTEKFLLSSAENEVFDQRNFYSIVSCSGKENGEYDVFCGRSLKSEQVQTAYEEYIVPAGWYAKFLYSGDMFEISEVFTEDLYKWVMVNEAELNPNGIGMLNIYEKDYPVNNEVQILVPIKKPV